MLILNIYSRADFYVEIDKGKKEVIVYSIITEEEIGRWNCSKIWDSIFHIETGYNKKMIDRVADGRVEEFIHQIKDVNEEHVYTTTRFEKVGEYFLKE